jgi:hypothetical protein
MIDVDDNDTKEWHTLWERSREKRSWKKGDKWGDRQIHCECLLCLCVSFTLTYLTFRVRCASSSSISFSYIRFSVHICVVVSSLYHHLTRNAPNIQRLLGIVIL